MTNAISTAQQTTLTVMQEVSDLVDTHFYVGIHELDHAVIEDATNYQMAFEQLMRDYGLTRADISITHSMDYYGNFKRFLEAKLS